MLATLARNGSTVWSTRFLESLGAKQLLDEAGVENDEEVPAPSPAKSVPPEGGRHGVTLTK
jgi:hypothetical protein